MEIILDATMLMYNAVPNQLPGLFSCCLTEYFSYDISLQVLLTNCKQFEGSSVEILLDAKLGVIVFQIQYKVRNTANNVESSLQVAVPYTVSFVPKTMI